MPIDNDSLDAAARRIGDRWTLRVVADLLDGDRTFGELADAIDGLAPNILTARLKALQADGVVVARPYQRNPVRMRYSLTAAGRRLGDAIALLADWGVRRRGVPVPARHAACGTPMELRRWCPTCDAAVPPLDDDGSGLVHA